MSVPPFTMLAELSRKRPSLACMTAGVLTFAGWTPAGPLPSSLVPGSSGTLYLSHERSRAVACKRVRMSVRSACDVRRETTDSSTSLTLRPVISPGIAARDERRRIEVEFGAQKGRQERRLEIAPGEWELAWSGYAKRPHFLVMSGDEFEIGLTTFKGACRLSGGECAVDDAVTARECLIPEVQRVHR